MFRNISIIKLLTLIYLMFFAALAFSSDKFLFQWKETFKGQVISSSSNKSHSSTMGYDITVRKTREGNYRIVFDNPKYKNSEGKFVNIKEVNKLPGFLISNNGFFLALDGFADSNRRLLKSMPNLHSKENKKIVERVLGDENRKKVVEKDSLAIWNTWVGTWNGLEIRNGKRFSEGNSIDGQGGYSTYEHLGDAISYCKNCVRLKYTNDISGPAALRDIKLNSKSNTGFKFLNDIERANRKIILEVITERGTLRPYLAKFRAIVIVKLFKVKEFVQESEKEYRFLWDK